ncbi:MAG: DNA mismatch repair protein [Bacteroidia bacterium]|nr:DNA mismatch repair protein [Bacteroidia bacterium]
MSFIIDKQTLDDLNIFGKHGHNSLFTLFCHTYTRGGANLLEDMFRYPLDNVEKINTRAAKIKFFQNCEIDFPYKVYQFDVVERYLENTDDRTKLSLEDNTLNRKFRSAIGAENEYELLHKGVVSMIDIINTTKDFVNDIKTHPNIEYYKDDIVAFEHLFQHSNINWTEKEKGKNRLSYSQIAEYDRILRYEENVSMRKLLGLIFFLDIYISVGKIGKKQNFVFAKAINSTDNELIIKGLHHPQLEKPISNDIGIDKNANFVFLTGANMAGKSTFMKSLGVAVFLAHVGFPVPASFMKFSVLDGLYTTINLPDNLNLGYSHFYTEVLRVKRVAQDIAKDKKYFVIFDELFRGTNVKDAYDATVVISEAFSKRNKSTFIISTHIIEAGETLQEKCKNIQFLYLPTVMENGVPTYTYKLKEGITEDRHGMVIIRNEGILEILNS